MIREWTADEAQVDKRLANFMKAFEGATSLVKVDSDYTFEKYANMMKIGMCKIFISEDAGVIQGAIGFLIADDFHFNRKIGIETFWFVHPDYAGVGKQLFNAFELEAAKAGCKALAMIHLADSYPDSLERFYVKNGYKLLEKHYVKEI